ncbi:hypothetical protein FQA39_LY18626 [Lamprigera yunnana]|nr:hypothetical protein FQA39_LY18626 [Lamprigera yunnana]
MKQKELLIGGLLISHFCIAQVGRISTGDKAGVTVPLLTGDQIEAINPNNIKPGTLAIPQARNCCKDVYNTDISDLNFGTIDLYNNLKGQFATPMVSSGWFCSDIFTPIIIPKLRNIMSNMVMILPVFTNVKISEKGILTYSFLRGADTSKPSIRM